MRLAPPLAWFALGALAPAQAGCATVAFRAAEVSDRELGRSTGVERTSGFVGTLEQTGARARVEVAHACSRVETITVEQTKRSRRYNATPAGDIVWLIIGAGVAGAGAGILADAHNVGQNAKDVRVYNSYGPDKARGMGGAFLGIGGALLLIPIIDLARTSGTLDEVDQVKVQGKVLVERLACPSAPAGGLAVAAEIGAKALSLGDTDRAGRLELDLARAVPVEVTEREDRPAELAVASGKQRLGRIDLAPVFAAHEASAWSAIDLGPCRKPARSIDCDALATYASRFPRSAHAAEARAMVDKARPELDRMADDEAWTNGEPQRCAKPDAEEACRGVERYLERSGGRHADEARALLKKVKPKLDALRRKRELEERLAAAREAAEARRRAADQGAAVSNRAAAVSCALSCSDRARDACADKLPHSLSFRLCKQSFLKGCCPQKCHLPPDNDIGCRTW